MTVMIVSFRLCAKKKKRKKVIERDRETDRHTHTDRERVFVREEKKCVVPEWRGRLLRGSLEIPRDVKWPASKHFKCSRHRKLLIIETFHTNCEKYNLHSLLSHSVFVFSPGRPW